MGSGCAGTNGGELKLPQLIAESGPLMDPMRSDHFDGGAFVRPPPEGFPVVLGPPADPLPPLPPPPLFPPPPPLPLPPLPAPLPLPIASSFQ